MPKFPGAPCAVTGTLSKQPTNTIPWLCSASWKPRVILHPGTTTDKSSGGGDTQLSKTLSGHCRHLKKGYQEEAWIFFLVLQTGWRFLAHGGRVSVNRSLSLSVQVTQLRKQHR